MVETFTIDTDDGTLRDKGVGVNLIDDLKDQTALATLGQHEEHLHVTTRIETLGIDDSTAAMGLTIDALTDLVVLVGDDEELHTATHGVHHLVDTEGRHIEHHIAVNDLLPVFQYEVGRGDDDDIADENDTAQRDVTVLVDDGRHDICSSRRTVGCQTQTYARATEYRTDDGGHKGLVVQQMAMIGGTDVGRPYRQHNNGEDGLHTELPAQYPQCDQQEDGIDAKVSPLHGNTRTPKKDGRDTWHTTRGDTVGQQEDVPTDTVGHHRDEYRRVILEFIPKHKL